MKRMVDYNHYTLESASEAIEIVSQHVSKLDDVLFIDAKIHASGKVDAGMSVARISKLDEIDTGSYKMGSASYATSVNGLPSVAVQVFWNDGSIHFSGDTASGRWYYVNLAVHLEDKC